MAHGQRGDFGQGGPGRHRRGRLSLVGLGVTGAGVAAVAVAAVVGIGQLAGGQTACRTPAAASSASVVSLPALSLRRVAGRVVAGRVVAGAVNPSAVVVGAFRAVGDRAIRDRLGHRDPLCAGGPAQLLVPEPSGERPVRGAPVGGVRRRGRLRRLPDRQRTRRVGDGAGDRPVPGLRRRAHRPQRARLRRARAAQRGADQRALSVPGRSAVARPDHDGGQIGLLAVLAGAAGRQHRQPARLGAGGDRLRRLDQPRAGQLQLLDRAVGRGRRPVHRPAHRRRGSPGHPAQRRPRPRRGPVHRGLHVRRGRGQRPDGACGRLCVGRATLGRPPPPPPTRGRRSRPRPRPPPRSSRR